MPNQKLFNVQGSAPLGVSQKSGKRGYAPTLGVYLAKGWAVMLGFTLLGLGGFMALLNALEALRQAAGRPTTPLEAVVASLLKIPDLMLQLWPFAVLIATLVWLHGLNTRSELVALRASGLAARRFLIAPLMACVFLSGFAVAVINPLSASLFKNYQNWENRVAPKAARGVLTPAGSLWLRQDIINTPEGISQTQMMPHTLFMYGAQVAGQGTQLISASAFVFGTDNTLLLRFDAAEANLEAGYWRLKNATMWRANQAPTQEPMVRVPTTLTPAALAASLNPPPTLNIVELSQLVGILQANGWPNAEHKLVLANLVILPFLALAMLLLAVPFGLRSRRSKGIWVPIGLGLALGFGFYALRNWVGAYAVAGRIEPWLAASVPVAVAILLAVFLLVWLREE